MMNMNMMSRAPMLQSTFRGGGQNVMVPQMVQQPQGGGGQTPEMMGLLTSLVKDFKSEGTQPAAQPDEEMLKAMQLAAGVNPNSFLTPPAGAGAGAGAPNPGFMQGLMGMFGGK